MIAQRPTLHELLRTALYVGAVGYGGPAILALMKKVIVHEKRWISEEEFLNALSLWTGGAGGKDGSFAILPERHLEESAGEIPFFEFIDRLDRKAFC